MPDKNPTMPAVDTGRRTIMQEPSAITTADATTSPSKPATRIVVQPLSDADTASSGKATDKTDAVTLQHVDSEPTSAAESDADLEADAKAQDAIDTLIEQKTYFLPINAIVQRRSRHVFIFGTILILLLAAAWLDIALDAGFVSVPWLQPLTHIFHS